MGERGKRRGRQRSEWGGIEDTEKEDRIKSRKGEPRIRGRKKEG